jgi:hypothetical protein
MPPIRDEVTRFSASASAHPERWLARAVHFLSLGWRRALAERRIRRITAAAAGPGIRLDGVQRTVGATLRAIERAAQFSTCERLFSLWHVVHVPFVYLLAASAVIHVLAVHMY